MFRTLRFSLTESHATKLIAFAIIVIAAPSCKKIVVPVAPPPPTVQIIEAKAQDVPITVDWIGTLQGSVTASIRSQVEGTLMRQDYEEGRPVKKGDILFDLDDRTYKTVLAGTVGELDQAKANLGKSASDVTRLSSLLQSKAVSQQDYDNAVQTNLANKSAVASAQVAMDKAQLDVDFTKIKSPIDGVAGLAKGQVGDLVTAGNMELTTVATINPIKAYFTVGEQEYLRYHQDHSDSPEGRQAGKDKVFQLILSTGDTYPHKGSFFASDVTVNSNTGAIRLCAIFDNPENILLPGQYVRVHTVTRVDKDAILVPQRAVNDLQTIKQIAVVTADGKASIRTVKVGPRVKSNWLIEEGIKAGDKVIVEGFLKIREGIPVNTVPFDSGVVTTEINAPAREAK